ncbi:MAG TPA: GDP-mannose 4,6-dehydratase [Anaerolineae bacterium]|nr:GDP-mannose 4,6-dehydratase [Anaerolineae bacterium]HOR00353.1 GDP-mannose 4,6-dehydratase [Anaerolineae bacterium]HPL28838.1 GDP-mannose 4,6-dehydratase [Anaerolineae bacterium]
MADNLVKRAFITGIAGFAGSHLAEHLLGAGYEVSGLSLPAGGTHNIDAIKGRLRLYLGDMEDTGWLRGVLADIRPDYVFHLAAQAAVPQAWASPGPTLVNNILGQLNLIEALLALELRPRLLIIGSADEYGLVRPDELPVRETNPLRPNNPYSVSKIAQDYLGYQYFLSHHLPIVRLRPFTHIGPRQGTGFVTADFAKQIAEAEAGLRPPLLRVGNLTARRDFTDVRDVVHAYTLALERGEPGEVYNVGSERAYSIQEVLEVLLGLSRLPLQVEPDPARLRPSDVPELVSDCTKLRERTGWRPNHTLNETLRDVLEYWRERVRKT